MMFDINQSPIFWPHTNKANQHLNILASPQSPLQTHFDLLCTVIEAHKKDAMTNLASLLWLGKNLISAEESGASTCTLKEILKYWGFV